jgi:hypothetical protein
MRTMIADMTRGRINPACTALGVALLSLALLASGCARLVDKDDDARMVATPEQTRSAPTQPAVRPQEAVLEPATQKTPTTTSKQPAAPQELKVEEPAPPAPAYSASELMGKSEEEVTALMGAPARIEQRAASTVWVYQGSDCGLDVFFFLDMATSDERVLTVAPTAESAAAAAKNSAAAAKNSTTGKSTADEAGGSAPTAEGIAVDACYDKLRRS